MPKVPVLDQPSVRPAALPVQASNLDVRGASGAVVAQGVQQLSQGLAQAAETFGRMQREEENKLDQVASAEATADFDTARSKSLYAPADPNVPGSGGVMAQRGTNAGKAAGPALESLEQRRQEIAKAKFSDPEKRALWLAQSGQHMAATDQAVWSHVSQQGEVAADAAVELGRKAKLDLISNAYANPEVRDRAAVEMEQQLTLQAHRKGIPAEPLVGQFRKDAAKVTLTRYLGEQDYAGAKTYFAQVKDALGDDAPQLEHQLNTLGAAVEASTERSRILTEATDPRTGWVDPNKAMAAARAVPDAKLWKKELVSQVESDVSHSQKQAEQQAGQVFDLALSTLQQGHPPGSKAMSEFKAWLTDPLHASAGGGGLWNKVQKQWTDDNRAERAVRAQEKQAQQEADKLGIATFEAMNTEDRAQANVNDMFAGKGLSTLGVQSIRVKQREAKEKYAKGLSPGERDFNALVDGAAMHTRDLNDSTADAKTGRTLFKAYMQNWYAGFPSDKKPTRKDVKEEIAGALRYGKKSSWYRFGGALQFQQEPGVEYAPVPPEDQPYEGNKVPVAPPSEAPPPGATSKSLVTGPNGKQYSVDESGLDDWLKAHPGWRRDAP